MNEIREAKTGPCTKIEKSHCEAARKLEDDRAEAYQMTRAVYQCLDKVQNYGGMERMNVGEELVHPILPILEHVIETLRGMESPLFSLVNNLAELAEQNQDATRSGLQESRQ